MAGIEQRLLVQVSGNGVHVAGMITVLTSLGATTTPAPSALS